MAEFTKPSFLLNHSTKDNHKRMIATIPVDIDMSEGGHAWNMTRPTALIAAHICEFLLPEAIKLIFPMWSYGQFLDYHAEFRGMSRRKATAAIGKISITGMENSVIPSGTTFSTVSINGSAIVEYETIKETKIPESGVVVVEVKCTQNGTVGNSGANTVIMVTSRLNSVKSVTNPEPMTGGTEEETDESLIERISEFDKSQGDNFVGSISDYKRWATSIDGVGGATVIPAQDTSGLVTIVLTDTNGSPATEQLCTSVYNHIMRPDNPLERLAPVNAILSVKPPDTVQISVKATVELTEGSTLDTVNESFLSKIKDYLVVALDEREIKYTRIAAVLAATEGANDFTDLQIGIDTGESISFGISNIPLTISQLPEISKDNLFLTSGTV